MSEQRPPRVSGYHGSERPGEAAAAILIDPAVAQRTVEESNAHAARLERYPIRVAADWTSEEQRIARVAALAAERLGVADYRITYAGAAQGDRLASFDITKESELKIRRPGWTNCSDRERVETIGHEMFHAYQWKFWTEHVWRDPNDPDTARAKRWEPAKSPRSPGRAQNGSDDAEWNAEYVAYWTHPFEVDARAFGEEFADAHADEWKAD